MTETALLEVSGLRAGYGRTEVLHGVDVSVRAGELVALIGSNGAGKSTLLKAVVGLVSGHGGLGRLRRAPIGSGRPERLVREGVALVPEGRLLFGPMTVRENLELGAYGSGTQARRGSSPRLRAGVRAVPGARRACEPAGRDALRWRAADARGGARADVAAAAAAPRRAVAWALRRR